MEAAAAAETHVWRQIILNYSTSSTFKTTPSWDQEKAFAADIAAVWPPRSYSCNFCMRQFRSAQALGGHMNVHRRDRARLQNNHPHPPLFIKPTPTVHLQTPKINRSSSSSHSSAFSPKRPKLSLSSSSSNSQDLLDLELKL